MASKLKDYIIYYKKKMERNTDEDIILNSIHKLAKVPMTSELLQETGIGKAIRNYSKESGKIGDTARILYQKWKSIIAESVQTSTKLPAMKSDKKAHSSKNKTKIHDKGSVLEVDSFGCDGTIETSSNYVPINDNISHVNPKCDAKDASEEPLYAHVESECANECIDYDPLSSINLGYCTDQPKLDAKSCNDFLNKECVEKSKHTAHIQKSISQTSRKHKSECISEQSSCDTSKSKKKKTDNMQLTSHEHKSHKIGLDSKTFKAKNLEKDKTKNLSSVPAELKRSKHESKDISKSEKNKHFFDSKQKLSSSKHVSSNSTTNKLCNEKAKSKVKLNLEAAEEFTSSEVNFEDCLGFNDMISVRKKTVCSKSVKKKEFDSGHKMNRGSSSASFEDCLGLNDSIFIKKKKKSKSIKKNEFDAIPKMSSDGSQVVKGSPQVTEKGSLAPGMTSTRLLIQPNCKSFVHKSPEFSSEKKKALTSEDAIKFISSKKERTAVYSGRRQHTVTKVPTLFNACIEVLSNHIDAIGCLGGTPYFIVKPLLERCTPAQLLNIENFNPHFLDETQDLWEIYCRRDFRNMKPGENETWRDMYLRALDEREKRLKSITANISASMSKSAPSVRKAKLAYVDSVVKPPRDVARRQAKHGTALPIIKPVKVSPSSRVATMSTAPTINVVASTSAAPIIDAVASTSEVAALKKPKVAPLMAKTLKTFKQCFRR